MRESREIAHSASDGQLTSGWMKLRWKLQVIQEGARERHNGAVGVEASNDCILHGDDGTAGHDGRMKATRGKAP